jgi:hypothetical protein
LDAVRARAAAAPGTGRLRSGAARARFRRARPRGAPYNAAWADGRLVGFFDWDLAGPVTREWDLAFTAFSWVPLHARHVVAAEGFTAFADRPRRLRLFLETYRWDGRPDDFVTIVRERVSASAHGIRRNAAAGDPAYQRMIEQRKRRGPGDGRRRTADFPAV